MGGFRIKGLNDEIYFDVEKFKVAVNDVCDNIETVFGHLDVDFETAILVAKQSTLLKDVGFHSCEKHQDAFGDTLKVVFDYEDGLRYYFLLHRDENGDVEYGYYRHDYVYVIDGETNKTICNFLIDDGEISIWV